MYFGPIGERFSDVLGYIARMFHRRPADGANPADFVLELSSMKEGEQSPADVWRASEEAKQAQHVCRFPSLSISCFFIYLFYF